ncbi:MAG: aldehyde dehydrogenase family protein, partial [Telluria sp.]
MKQNYIDGAWVDGASTTANINPSNTNDIIGHYAQADAQQAQMAIAAAAAAAPGWALSNVQMRADALDKIGSEIIARKEELGTLLSREEGKTRVEGIGEAARAGAIFKFFAQECLRLRGDKLPSVRPNLD